MQKIASPTGCGRELVGDYAMDPTLPKTKASAFDANFGYESNAKSKKIYMMCVPYLQWLSLHQRWVTCAAGCFAVPLQDGWNLQKREERRPQNNHKFSTMQHAPYTVASPCQTTQGFRVPDS
jgi:hypothetical protein